MGVALAICAIVPAMFFAVLASYYIAATASGALEQRYARASSLYSVILRSKLSNAETIVQTLTDRDVGYDGASLKQDIANSRAFKSVVVVDRDGRDRHRCLHLQRLRSVLRARNVPLGAGPRTTQLPGRNPRG